MELNYDWKNFQSLFYSKRRLTQNEVALTGPVYLVTEENVVVAAFSEGEDLSDWLGATYDEVVAEFQHRQVVHYDREKVDQWMKTASGLPHFYDQIQYVRSESKLKLMGKHFLLQGIQSWWQKVLPSSYGVYIQLSGGSQASPLLLIIQRGRINSFHVPDFNTMVRERRKHPADVVKYLSEKYLVPVLGIFASSAEWDEWSEDPHPWPKIVKAIKADRNKLVPFQWGLATLIKFKAYFGL